MSADRREFLATAGAAFTSSIFTGNLKGANDRIAVGFIGAGRQGNTNLGNAMRQPGVQVAAICDVYQPRVESAVAAAQRAGHQPKGCKDFRDVLADKSIDAVCIATPDHWHALMTVEACKASKDVYVEKPVCTYVDEAPKMVQAARKYNRVVQAGTHHRSAGHIPAVREILSSGQLGQVTFARVWLYSLEPQEGIGNPPDMPPPPGLDWDLWLGPARYHAFNQNRFAVDRGMWGAFRYYWDYAGGQLSDNGIHFIDMLQTAFNETAPTVVTALAAKTYLKDSRETPDTEVCLYQYPEFIMSYEHRYGNAQSMFGRSSGVMVYGSKGTLFIGAGGAYSLYPEREPALSPENPVGSLGGQFGGAVARGAQPGASETPATAPGGGAAGRGAQVTRAGGMQPRPAEAPKASIDVPGMTPTVTHWGNFLECMRTRQKPVADIEYVARSAVTALLGNIAFRAKVRVEYDPKTWTSPQREVRALMAYNYRPPWKLEV